MGGFVATEVIAAAFTAQPDRPQGVSIPPGAAVVSSDGLTLTYTTTGGDFLESGPWLVQGEVQDINGSFSTQPGSIYIFERVGPWPARYGTSSLALASPILAAIGTVTGP